MVESGGQRPFEVVGRRFRSRRRRAKACRGTAGEGVDFKDAFEEFGPALSHGTHCLSVGDGVLGLSGTGAKRRVSARMPSHVGAPLAGPQRSDGAVAILGVVADGARMPTGLRCFTVALGPRLAASLLGKGHA